MEERFFRTRGVLPTLVVCHCDESHPKAAEHQRDPSVAVNREEQYRRYDRKREDNQHDVERGLHLLQSEEVVCVDHREKLEHNVNSDGGIA